MNTKEIILADDVVFSGTVLKTIIQKFSQNGISVIGIRACISSREGYDYFNNTLYAGLKCGFLMSKDVIDQICERDFYYGVAGSGISVREGGEILKSPYIKPFGEPDIRASVPLQYVNPFSYGCLKRSIALWEESGRLTNRDIMVSDLPEKITYTNDSDTVVKALKRGFRACIR